MTLKRGFLRSNCNFECMLFANATPICNKPTIAQGNWLPCRLPASMPGRAARRGSNGRRQSLAAVPATPATAVPPTPGTAVDLQSPRVSRKVASFYGGGLPRPGMLADPEHAAMQVIKSQRGRVEFVSPVQALMGASVLP